jgi:acetylornithine/succinyldiaminopimelate/putrescine aminotransferase
MAAIAAAIKVAREAKTMAIKSRSKIVTMVDSLHYRLLVNTK